MQTSEITPSLSKTMVTSFITLSINKVSLKFTDVGLKPTAKDFLESKGQ
jgi:hypothetical protein